MLFSLLVLELFVLLLESLLPLLPILPTLAGLASIIVVCGLLTNTLVLKLLLLVAGENIFVLEKRMLFGVAAEGLEEEEDDEALRGLLLAFELKLKFKLFIKGSISDLGLDGEWILVKENYWNSKWKKFI